VRGRDWLPRRVARGKARTREFARESFLIPLRIDDSLPDGLFAYGVDDMNGEGGGEALRTARTPASITPPRCPSRGPKPPLGEAPCGAC
jgi:hypothetical protein